MDVRCPQCGTLFEFDERLMSGSRATLKCSVCAHIFRLERARSPQVEPEHAAAGAQGRWMLKRASDEGFLYFRNFEELHRAIMRGEVHEHDQLSRTGNSWLVLEDIGEFMPVFEAARVIAVAARPAPDAYDGPERTVPAASAPAPTELEASSAVPTMEPQPPERHTAAPGAQRERASTMLQFDTRPPSSPEPPAPKPMPRLDLPTAPRPDVRPQSQPPQQAPPQLALPPSPQHQPVTPPREPTPSPAAAPAPPARAMHPSEPLPAEHTPGPRPAPAASDALALEPADRSEEWSMGGLSLEAPMASPSGSFDDVAPPRGRSWGVILFVMVVLLGGGAAGVVVFMPELLEPLGLPGLGEPKQVALQIDAGADTPDEAPNEDHDAAPPAPALEQALGPAAASIASSLVAARDAASKTPADDTTTGEVQDTVEDVPEEDKEPDVAQILRRARRAQDAGRNRSAKKLFKEVLEHEPRNVKAISGLGWSMIDSNELSGAIHQFERAIDINARYEDAYIGLGAAERRLGNKRAALSAYERYLEKFPSGRSASIARHQRDELRQALGI